MNILPFIQWTRFFFCSCFFPAKLNKHDVNVNLRRGVHPQCGCRRFEVRPSAITSWCNTVATSPCTSLRCAPGWPARWGLFHQEWSHRVKNMINTRWCPQDTPVQQSRSFLKDMSIFSCVEAFPGSRAFLQNASKLWWSQRNHGFKCFCVFSCVQLGFRYLVMLRLYMVICSFCCVQLGGNFFFVAAAIQPSDFTFREFAAARARISFASRFNIFNLVFDLVFPGLDFLVVSPSLPFFGCSLVSLVGALAFLLLSSLGRCCWWMFAAAGLSLCLVVVSCLCLSSAAGCCWGTPGTSCEMQVSRRQVGHKWR